jgi:hypothetical protein
MPLMHEGVEYLNASEAAALLGISRQQFYDAVQPLLHTYHVGVRTRPYYKADDVRQRQAVKAEKPLPIVIHGIQKNFVKAIQALGIPCSVQNVGTPELVPVDESLAEVFGIPIGTPIVRRGRLQGVEGTPYRLVTNWYPTKYADPELVEEMRRNDDADMPALMKEKYGVIIEHIVEEVITRKATADECRLLKIRNGSTVFEIRRTNYATNGKDVVMVSDLILVARYFKLKYTYDTAHWTQAS